MFLMLLLIVGCLCAPRTLASPLPLAKGVLSIPDAAGTALLPNPTTPNQLDLVVNTFEPVAETTDEIYVVRDIVGQLASGNDAFDIEILATGLIWPSTVEAVPGDVFNSDNLYFTPGGFILSTKDIGTVTLIDASSQETIELVRENGVWFKKAIFLDVDNDGKKDILAGRTDTSDPRDVKTALVWFKQPDEDPFSNRWEENVLFEDAGPNFQYRIFQLSPTVTRHAIFTTQLFGQSLEVYWNDVIIDISESEGEGGDDSNEDDSDEDDSNEDDSDEDDSDEDDSDEDDSDEDDSNEDDSDEDDSNEDDSDEDGNNEDDSNEDDSGEDDSNEDDSGEDSSNEEGDDDDNAPNFFKLSRRIIESEGGNGYFDSTIADLNGDGKVDILATVSSTTNGKLVAFEIPEDWENGEWTQHVLADGFKPPEPNPRPGRGSPGRAQIFEPDNEPRNKPFILMTGDDDGKVYVVKPTNDADQSDWSYEADVVFDAPGNTIGDLTYADVDEDGLPEIFVPVFNAGQVHIITYENLDAEVGIQEYGFFSSSDSSFAHF